MQPELICNKRGRPLLELWIGRIKTAHRMQKEHTDMSAIWNDYNDAETQNSYDLIPKGTVVPVRMTFKPGGYDDPAQGWSGGYATRNDTTGVSAFR